MGRNEPCPCGSGKKYKQCCLSAVPVNHEVVDFTWRHLRQLEGKVVDQHLGPYVTEELPEEFFENALADILPEDLPDTIDHKLFFSNFFFPWFLFSWIPDAHFGVSQFDPELTIAQNYVKKHAIRLTSDESRFIATMNDTYYSFYSVLKVEAGHSLLIKDILLGTTHIIKEQLGTTQLQRGDIIFSRILTLDNQSIFIGMAPIIIPASYYYQLIDFRKWLVKENGRCDLDPRALHGEFARDILDYFIEILLIVGRPTLPTLCNTDGDLLQFEESHFTLKIAPEDTLQRLLPLTLSDDVESFLREAKRDKSGNITRLEFPWLKKGNKTHKDWENTLLGKFVITPGKLIIETNSEKRTQRAKRLLNKYLGEAEVSFQNTVIETPEQKLNSMPSPTNNTAEMENLLASPEAQAQMQAMAKSHWDRWFDEPIPALEHKTPREAAKTADGRERLEALLLQYERSDAVHGNENLLKADINYLRTELALDS